MSYQVCLYVCLGVCLCIALPCTSNLLGGDIKAYSAPEYTVNLTTTIFWFNLYY